MEAWQVGGGGVGGGRNAVGPAVVRRRLTHALQTQIKIDYE
jgi:hypothetical protein